MATEVETDTELEPGSSQWWDAHLRRLGRRRPRAGGLTVERIVGEALDLADTAGPEGLTVRALASRLGTSSATLYRHVASVDELLVLMIDRVLGEIETPPDDLNPRDRVLHHAGGFRDALRRHPGVVPALRSAPLLGPNAMCSAATGLSLLLDAGFEPAKAVPAYLALIDYTLGSVYFDSAAVGVARLRLAGQPSESVFADHADQFRANSSDDVFWFGLDVFLDGLADR